LSKEVREFASLVYGNVREGIKPLKARGNRMTAPVTGQGKSAKVKDDKTKAESRSTSARNQSLSKAGRVSQFYIPLCIFKVRMNYQRRVF